MAIDTREKRASVVGINRLAGPSVTPNSGQDQEWRQEVGYSYSGILAAPEVVPPGDAAPFIEDPARPFTPGHIMSGAELFQLIGVQTEILADSCSIERNEQGRDTQGGVKDAWRIVGQDVACRISARSGSERFLGDRRYSDSMWQLTVLTEQDISARDRVRHDSQIYEVTLVNEGRSFETVKRVMLRLLD